MTWAPKPLRWLLRALAVLSFWLLPTEPVAAEELAPPPLDVSAAGSHDLRRAAKLLVDPSSSRTIAELRDEALLRQLPQAMAEPVHQGLSGSSYWLVVSLVQRGPRPVQRFVRVYPTVDHVDAYLETRSGISHQRTGRLEPFGLRQVRDTDLLFPTDLAPNEPVRLFVRLAGSDVMRLDLEMLDAETLVGQVADRRLVWGVCYGMIAALCIYNLVLLFWLRDRAYMYYVVFQGALAGLVAAFDHLTLEYLWPNAPVWSASFETVAVMIAVYGGCGFVRSFLATASAPIFGARWLRFCQVGAVLLAIGFPLTAWRPFAILSIVFVMLATASVLVITTASVRSGNTSARFLLGSWLILSASALIVASSALTTWDVRWPLEHFVRLSSVVEAVLLSFGLAYRINRLRQDNDRLANDMLHQRVAALHHLVSGITHEIANPLHFIQSGAELLEARSKQGPEEAATTAPLEIIRNGSKRIALIVSNLRNQMSGTPSAFEPTDVAAVLRETLDLMMPRFTEQQITVRKDIADLPSVPSRPGELGQVFANLLLNACQAMPQGGNLGVEARAGAAAVQVTISDSGPGVPAELRASIFDPFFTTRGPKDGAGLGLYVALQIAWNHGGNLELVPSECGAKFRVTMARAPRPLLRATTNRLGVSLGRT